MLHLSIDQDRIAYLLVPAGHHGVIQSRKKIPRPVISGLSRKEKATTAELAKCIAMNQAC